MLKNKLLLIFFVFVAAFNSKAQTMKLDAILDSIATTHPVIKMYNNEIRSMDEAAKGAKSWMPPEFSTGFWMVPYNPNLWKRGDMGETGMGQYMIGGLQMLPNRKKQNADAYAYTNNGEREPLCGVYTAKGLAAIIGLLKNGELTKYSMKFMLDHLSVTTIAANEDQKKCFRNFNAHAELNGL